MQEEKCHSEIAAKERQWYPLYLVFNDPDQMMAAESLDKAAQYDIILRRVVGLSIAQKFKLQNNASSFDPSDKIPYTESASSNYRNSGDYFAQDPVSQYSSAQNSFADNSFSDIDEVSLHILKYHPDKTNLVDNRENVTARIWSTALELTRLSLSDTAHRKNTVLKTFKFYLRELTKSLGA